MRTSTPWPRLLAAQKLYPEARVVFPGSQEKNLRNFFISSHGLPLQHGGGPGRSTSTRVKRLVLVDTRQAGRIGRLAGLVGRPGVEIHIYDHHPAGRRRHPRRAWRSARRPAPPSPS
ncbi:MAG: hypothetical protein MZV70_07340 [Desulfobacterales bacterium]|nr:hypothetical protein [Desulfobacterales bacterium]